MSVDHYKQAIVNMLSAIWLCRCKHEVTVSTGLYKHVTASFAFVAVNALLCQLVAVNALLCQPVAVNALLRQPVAVNTLLCQPVAINTLLRHLPLSL